MSSFSSVVRKPGTKFAPKAAPRRNIPRRNGPPTPSQTPEVVDQSRASEENQRAAADNSQYASTSATSDVSQPSPRKEASSSSKPVRGSSDRQVHQKIPTRRSDLPREKDNGADANLNIGARITRSRVQAASGNSIRDQDQISRPDRHQYEDRGVKDVQTTAEHAASAPDHVTQTLKRKRKAIPGAGASLTLSQPTTITPPTTRHSVSSDRATSEASQRASVRESLEHATEQAAAVAELAQSIESRSAAIQMSNKRKAVHSTVEQSEAQTDAPEQENRKQPRKRQKQKKTIQQQAAEVVANATGENDALPRRRGATPEDLESHIIEEDEIKMGDLCEDRRWGQKSRTEKEMQENWPEILKRRREAKENALEEALNSRKRIHLRDKPAESLIAEMAQHTVEMDIVNGNIVALSREIDREEQLNRQIEQTIEVLEDKDIYKRVNSATIGLKNHIQTGQSWDDQTTELFYQGLQMFGTDFMMISNMIPGKNRKQVKLKYNLEERTNWHRVQRSLAEKQTVDLGSYSEMTGLAFSNAADVYKQMQEDEKRLREEDERRRRDEGIVQNEADVPVQSIEGEGTDGPEGTAEEAAREGRFDSTARQIVERATKKRQPRKTNASVGTRRGRQATSKAAVVEGTEERLGTIEEVAV